MKDVFENFDWCEHLIKVFHVPDRGDLKIAKKCELLKFKLKVYDPEVCCKIVRQWLHWCSPSLTGL